MDGGVGRIRGAFTGIPGRCQAPYLLTFCGSSTEFVGNRGQ